MPWVLTELTIGWPPSLKLAREPGDEKTLHELFTRLEDKRLLTHGYGTSAGITDLGDLATRIDAIRDLLRDALSALPPKADFAAWLRKLSLSSAELLTKTYEALGSSAKPAPDVSEIAPAVDQLREAFALAAEEVGARYELPAAQHLAARIRQDTESGRAAR